MADAVAPAHAPRLRTIRWRTVADRVLVLALILAAWQIGSAIVGTYWLSSPWATIARFAALTIDGELIRHAGYTLGEAAAGTLIGGVPAVLLPFVLRRHPVIVAILEPFMIGGYGAPKLAFAPLFILWFAGASERQVARHIVMPGAVPAIFAGFRIAVPYAIGAAVIAELISSNRGLGYLVQTGAMNFDTTSVFAAIAAATLVVLGTNGLMDGLERLLLKWRPPIQSMLESGT